MPRRTRVKETRPTAADCPDIEKHTACPDGYLAWHDWAEKMSKTHKQERCPTCGFFSVWVPKKAVHRPGTSTEGQS